MKHGYRDRFFADPFPLNEDNHYYYILAEEYKYIKGKGTIVKLTVDKKTMRLIKREDFLETNYHLSFPFTLGEYIVPEQSKSGKAYAYNNGKVEEVCKYPLIDPVFYNYRGNSYLFSTLPSDNISDPNQTLYLFKRNSEGKYDLLYPNPIVNNISCARCAGKIIEYEGAIIRVGQDCTRIYGGGLSFEKVTSFEPEYSEEHLFSVSVKNQNKYNIGMHTFNLTNNGYIIVDGFQYYTRPLLKVAMHLKGLGVKNAK
jgi:hypothetical protein